MNLVNMAQFPGTWPYGCAVKIEFVNLQKRGHDDSTKVKVPMKIHDWKGLPWPLSTSIFHCKDNIIKMVKAFS